MSSKPKSLAIIGGGAIGCELGQALSIAGVEVAIIEAESKLLFREEPDASDVVQKVFENQDSSLNVIVGAKVVSAKKTQNGKTLILDNGPKLEVDEVLVATGRAPNTPGEDLAASGIDLDKRGHIVTGDDLSTNVKGVYAAGDVTGKLPFTHAADFMGRLASQNILSRFYKAKFNPEVIPWVTFISPEVARIGLTESQAAERFSKSQIAELPLSGHDRAIVSQRTDGFIKLISGPNKVIGMAGGGRLVGATIVADRAGEMISELALAMRVNAFVGRLAQTVHPYPSWSYGIAKAAAQFFTTIEGRTARPCKK